MRISLNTETAFHLINNGPCCLISSCRGSVSDAAPITWTMPLNDEPPLVAAAVYHTHTTARLIQESKSFIMNVLGEPMLPALYQCGRCHGNKTDKFKKFNIETLPGKKVNVPFLKHSLAHIECELADQRNYEGMLLFVGKVVHAEVESEFWLAKENIWDTKKAKLIHHLSGNRFSIDERTLEA